MRTAGIVPLGGPAAAVTATLRSLAGGDDFGTAAGGGIGAGGVDFGTTDVFGGGAEPGTFGAGGYALGLWLSVPFDFPAGPFIVVALASLVLITATVRRFLR